MDMSQVKVAVVAALEREVWPFVKDWPTSCQQHDGRTFKFFEKQGTAVVCGGMGAEAARRAAEAVIQLYHPTLIVSAGFAGALDSSLPVGHTFMPQHVIDASDGSRAEAGGPEGILISFETVADVEQKARFATAFGAHAVDMEAAAVARAAEARGVKFLACKVISDTSDSRLPPIAPFIAPDGSFQALKFVLHIAVRPWLWKGLRRLARDSARAAQSLGVVLEKHGQVWKQEQPTGANNLVEHGAK
jgi:nucleoside phosphorylase